MARDGVLKQVANVAGVAPGLFSADASGAGVPAGSVTRTRADGSQSNEAIARFAGYDANDVLNWFRSSEDYDPEPALGRIRARSPSVKSRGESTFSGRT